LIYEINFKEQVTFKEKTEAIMSSTERNDVEETEAVKEKPPLSFKYQVHPGR